MTSLEVDQISNSGKDSNGKSSNQSTIDDHGSPYFLHYLDSPGLILVSQLLTKENYASWSRSILIALFMKNKLGFVDGSIEKPSGENSDLLNCWMRNNNIVIAWLLNSVSKEISASLLYSTFAYEIWNDLRDRFEQSNGPRMFQLLLDLVNLH